MLFLILQGVTQTYRRPSWMGMEVLATKVGRRNKDGNLEASIASMIDIDFRVLPDNALKIPNYVCNGKITINRLTAAYVVHADVHVFSAILKCQILNLNGGVEGFDSSVLRFEGLTVDGKKSSLRAPITFTLCKTAYST